MTKENQEEPAASNSSKEEEVKEDSVKYKMTVQAVQEIFVIHCLGR